MNAARQRSRQFGRMMRARIRPAADYYQACRISCNIVAGCEAPQTSHGDIFGPYFDEIMQRVQKVKHTVQIAERQDWGAGFRRLEGVVTW